MCLKTNSDISRLCKLALDLMGVIRKTSSREIMQSEYVICKKQMHTVSRKNSSITHKYCVQLRKLWVHIYYSQFLTLPSSVSRSATPLKVVELGLWEERLLLTVRSRSASGVVTVLARPSTAAFSSYSFLMISSCRASRALTAGSTSPFWGHRESHLIWLIAQMGIWRCDHVQFQQFEHNPAAVLQPRHKLVSPHLHRTLT